jgi:hypothetical protein
VMANATASRHVTFLTCQCPLDRHHGDEMNVEKGTRCNELKVLATILFRSKYGREVMRPTDKTVRANYRHLDR